METHNGHKHSEKKHTCFLCALDPRPCAVTQLEGRIVSAHERRINGEMRPFITLDTGTVRASLGLTTYYRSLVKELQSKGDAMRRLTLRVYHLPTAAEVGEYQGQPIHRYNANSYTLAVLEPDTLLNITDLNQAEYCPRQYLLHRLIPSPASAATLRGNLVHYCFKELLKEHDRGELMTGHTSNDEETPQAMLHRHLEQALERNSIELALNNVPIEEMRSEVAPHLESLATWYQHQRATLWNMPTAYTDGQTEETEEQHNENLVRAETFLLAPEIGLRGRLDLLWRQTGRQRLLELKTGGAKGALPKRDHQWQVRGYHALLTVRRDSKMKKALATLLYSGTPGEAQAFAVLFTVRELQQVNETRNILVLSHVTGIPPAPPGPSRCTKCMMLDQCEGVSALLNWQPPEPDRRNELRQPLIQLCNDASASTAIAVSRADQPYVTNHSPDDKEFFAKYYQLLHLEGRESELQQALLWQTPVTERIERGTAISGLEPVGKPEPTGQGEWRQTFRCGNTSELREGDEILLSDGDPITGEVVTGNVVTISAEEVTVWSPELIAHPALIDRYDNNIVHVRTLQNLLRWLQTDAHLRGLVAGNIRPQFNMIEVPRRTDFNEQQNLAVERAMQMQNYLLVHGPPGTGKTSVIAEIVKRLCQQGQRVILAAFTNQAVDNMLKRLDKEGFHDYVRLGNDRSVHEDVRERLLKELVKPKEATSDQGDSLTVTLPPGVYEVLRNTPVVASTTATWSSEKYSPQVFGRGEDTATSSFLQFDVVVIDEAGQLTIPAILGALRFAKRFILVGDEKQLPPLVLSKEAAEQGLADSLFGFLKRLDDSYKKNHLEAVSACVPLEVQYRMNKWISNFSSKVFYQGQLMPHSSVANRILALKAGGTEPVIEAPTIRQALQPHYPLVFLDVPGDGEQNGPKVSNAEARIVRELVHGLLRRGIMAQDIGIIAPYRAQVANLRRHLFSEDTTIGWQALKPNTPMSIDTVDRFQGGERQVIIMSFATSSTPEVDSPLRDFLTNPHRLNVALTRAQCKLMVVGCAPALEALPYFQRLIAYCRSMQTIFSHL